MHTHRNPAPHRTIGQNTQRVRTTPILCLQSGECYGQVIETPQTFGERVSFGPVTGTTLESNPAKWLAQTLETAARFVSQNGQDARPIIVPAPHTALAHSATAVSADAAIRQTQLCHQEICIEFDDAALAGDTRDNIHRLAAIKRKGFRIAIDMRKSWTTPLCDSLRLLIDAMRVDARRVEHAPALQERMTAAHQAGVLIIAEHAHWRDGDYLETLGALCATRPIADA